MLGPEEEDISIYSESAFLADQPSADIVAYFRHGASKTHIVELESSSEAGGRRFAEERILATVVSPSNPPNR